MTSTIHQASEPSLSELLETSISTGSTRLTPLSVSLKRLPFDSQQCDSGYGDEDLGSVEYISKYGYLDPMISAASLIVYSMLNAREADSGILECGCGSGYVLPTLIQMKKPSCKLYMTDISSVKLSLVRDKCELLSENPLSNELFEHSRVPPENSFNCGQVYANEKLNVYVEHADATCLQYPSNSFDVYFGGLLIQEVTDPFSAIQEAFRVLLKGGRAGFTIYDTQEMNNEFDWILIKAIENITGERTHIKYTDQHTKMNVTQLKTYLVRAGFKNILFWTQFVPYNFFTKQDFSEYLERGHPSELLNNQQKLVREEAIRIFEATLRAKQTPFGMNTLCIVASKPL